MSAWRFVATRRYFLDVLDDWWTAYRKRCIIAARSEYDRLEAEEKEFFLFLDSIDNLMNSNTPLEYLTSPHFAIAISMQDIMELQCGKWRAFFSVNRIERTIAGLIILHGDHTLALLEQMLEIAITESDAGSETRR